MGKSGIPSVPWDFTGMGKREYDQPWDGNENKMHGNANEDVGVRKNRCILLGYHSFQLTFSCMQLSIHLIVSSLAFFNFSNTVGCRLQKKKYYS